jgi:hypothetical protein
MDKELNNKACEPTALTYGMSAELRDSGLLTKVRNLSHSDKTCLVRYIYDTDTVSVEDFDNLNDEQLPYTMDELNARIDEAEMEIERGEGKSFEQMMDGFRKELLWLK